MFFTDNRGETGGLKWLRGGTAEQGLYPMNFQSVGLVPWIQQRLDLTLLANDHNQQYQAMLANGLQNLGNGDPLRQQFIQLQQPLPYLQQSGGHNSDLLLQQQQQQQQQQQPHPQPHSQPQPQLPTQQPHQHNLMQTQSQVLNNENISWHHLQQQLNGQQKEQVLQQDYSFHNALKIQNDHLQQWQQANTPSVSFRKTDIMESNSTFASPISPIQNMLASTCPEGIGNFLNFSKAGQSMLAEQLPQQSWAPKHPPSEVAFAESLSYATTYPGKDPVVEPENCNPDVQNPILLGVNVDSSGLLVPTTVPSFTTSIDADVSSPLADSGFQNSLYGCMQDSSELLHATRQVDSSTPTRTFVKVKTASN